MQIDRILVAASTIPLPLLVAVNKRDLLTPDGFEASRKQLLPYEALGVEVVWCSALQPEGVNPLLPHLRGHKAVLVGPSGGGKSSLITALFPTAAAITAPLSKGGSQGRHTTSVATLYPDRAGGFLIDSPGIRNFGLWHLEEKQILAGFQEFLPLRSNCRFSNCRHLHEPGCAIKGAVERGEISHSRYQSYQALLAEANSVVGH